MYKVHLIGSGYESVKWFFVEAETPREAITKVESMDLSMYHFLEIEAEEVRR